MANQAAKKADARAKDFKSTHGYAILAVVLFYAAMRLLIFKNSMTNFHYYALGGSIVVHWICYKTILGHIEFGGQMYDKVGMVELSVDTLYILIFTQVCAAFSDNAWYIMVLIPLILVYKYAGTVLGFMFGGIFGGGGQEDVDPSMYMSKTQLKKQKRAEKFSGGGGR